MNDRRASRRGARWGGGVVWSVGTAALIAALPWAASGRLPDRLATHWTLQGGAPDGSMPLWAASVFPAAIWLFLAAVVLLTLRRGADAAHAPGEPWASTSLLAGGTLLAGAQAAVVRANLDRADWHDARQPTPWLVAILGATAIAGVTGWLVSSRRRRTATPAAKEVPQSPLLRIPEGQRMVWLSRTANPWLQALAAATGLVAVAAAVALVSGLVEQGPGWALFTPFALASLAVAGCAAVQARVSERGLEVAFGPFGWPVRRWDAADIESARTEDRTPAQVGGWGYRISGLGSTVMLRGGPCLVVRVRGKGQDFAVSVDDAERGAALLNALSTPRSR
ncbi:DUF1648 domain-containing protein [Streptomyces similanensis]|uniref:DUF1648 domain-containing protein n=1 Tax=Streptomyces similanensis TaxID=1274988 RepID=A0ABP9KBV6_9ACTN